MATLTPASNMSDIDLEKNSNEFEPNIPKFVTFSSTDTEKEKDKEGVAKENWIKRQIDSFKPAEGETKVLQPQLSTFALQMIAIGGSIGTGLFIGSGEALAESGAGGLLICYTSVSFMIDRTLTNEMRILIHLVSMVTYFCLLVFRRQPRFLESGFLYGFRLRFIK